MSAERTVITAVGANAAAQGGTSAAAPVVPFLDVTLWTWTINGSVAAITPQAVIVITTGVLSAMALARSVWKGGGKA
jgi:hypothetical protein